MNAIHIIMNSARLLNDTDITQDSTLKDIELKKGIFYEKLVEEGKISPIEISKTAEELYAQHKNLRYYVNALNLVLGEIASQYIPVKKSFSETTTDKKISIKNLNYMAKILEVTNSKKQLVDYELENTDLVFERDGKYTITYNSIPLILDILSDVGFFADRLDYRVISYGVCAIFCLMTNRFEQYNIFERVYRDSLPNRVIQKSFNLPAKEWL